MRSLHMLVLVLGCIAGCQHARKQLITTSRPAAVKVPATSKAESESAQHAAIAIPVQSAEDEDTSRTIEAAAFQEPSDGGQAAGDSAVVSEPVRDLGGSRVIAAPLPSAAQTQASVSVNSAMVALSLDNVLETALVQNPDLVTLRGQVNVTRAVGGVTKVYPWNPFIQSQYFPNGRPFVPSTNPGSGAGMSNYYVWVMQRFELAHQRRYRAQIASATITQVQWNVQQAELLNVAQTMRLYFSALYQRELCELAIETAELNSRLLGVVERRFNANLGLPADLTTAKVAARQARRQADLADATYQGALLALRQQLRLRIDQPLELSQMLTDFAWESVQKLDAPELDGAAPPSESLAAQLVQGRPDLMAASAGIMVANANALLARAARRPDIQAGPIYETADDGTQYLGMRLQTDVPIWNTGAPLANQRCAELQQQRLTFAQLQEGAVVEAQMAIDRYERARRLFEKASADPTLVGGGVPDELRQITGLFEAGQAEVLAVFTIQANLLQDRRTYLDLLNETAQAAANVVQATAFPPQRLAIVRRLEVIPASVAAANAELH